jgi:hypothetical protein
VDSNRPDPESSTSKIFLQCKHKLQLIITSPTTARGSCGAHYAGHLGIGWRASVAVLSCTRIAFWEVRCIPVMRRSIDDVPEVLSRDCIHLAFPTDTAGQISNEYITSGALHADNDMYERKPPEASRTASAVLRSRRWQVWPANPGH